MKNLRSRTCFTAATVSLKTLVKDIRLRLILDLTGSDYTDVLP